MKVLVTLIALLMAQATFASNGNEIVVQSYGNKDNIKVEVYPNPNQGNFTVKITSKNKEEIRFKMFDSNGQLVDDRVLKADDKSIEMKDVKKGAYWVTIQQGKEMSFQRFSVQ